jgi:SET domain
VLPEKAAVAAFGGRSPSRADFQWAFSMLLSRLIRLGALGDTEALVPWADLLNHSPDSDAYLDWDTAQQAVVLRADTAAEPGQQVFASYGPKASGALLLRYTHFECVAEDAYCAWTPRCTLQPAMVTQCPSRWSMRRRVLLCEQ